jgi:hypothetical protein
LIGKSQGQSLTLFVPGLFGPGGVSDRDSPPLPALTTLLSRAEPIPAGARGMEAAIMGLFDLSAPPDGDLPVAPITRALDLGVIDKGWWLRADPVHLRPDRDRLILVDTHFVALTQDEATRLAAEVLEPYAREGWVLKAPRPGRWYLKPSRAARIQTTPLSEVVGHDIHPYLPKGKDGKQWHTVLNEMQILLHTATVNTERERRGELPINSLWFWGSGRLPEIRRVNWVRVHSEEPLSLALARLCETPSSARPGDFRDWQRQASPTGNHLVVLDQLSAAVQYRDVAAWSSAIDRIEQDWMAPAVLALKSNELREVMISSDVGRRFRVYPRHVRRWWRRRRPLSDFR